MNTTELLDPIFTKKDFPYYCESCKQGGYLFIDSFEGSYFVVCKNCGAETSEVWCPKCGMGGDFIRDIQDHPTSWVCEDCHSIYPLAEDFYTNPAYLYPRKDLPEEVLRLIHERDLERAKQNEKGMVQATPMQRVVGYLSILLSLAILFAPMAVALILVDIVPATMKLYLALTIPFMIPWMIFWRWALKNINRKIVEKRGYVIRL